MIYLVLVVILTWVVLRTGYHRYLSQKWNCGRIFMDPASYISFVRDQSKNQELGNALEQTDKRLNKIPGLTVGHNAFISLVIETANPENIKALHATQVDDFCPGYRQVVLRPLLGYGVFAADGDRWKHSRDMLKPQFAREQISHIQMLEPHFQNFVKVVSALDRPCDIQNLFYKLTFDVTTDFLYGETTRTLLSDLESQEFSEAFGKVQDIIMKKLVYGPLHWMYMAPGYQRALDMIHKSVGLYVQRVLQLSDQELSSHKGYVFLHELVKQTRDPKVLQDELLSLLIAGRNTTTCLLTFVFFELSKNPEIWDKLKLEVNQTFGPNTTVDDITFDSMKKCRLIRNVINETLRMYPPVSRNIRVAKKNTTLPQGGGVDGKDPIFVPKGSGVLFCVYSLHRLKAFGKKPHEFNPDRWESIKPGTSYLPFGLGPRICLGQQFALAQATYIIIRIAQTFPFISENTREYPPKKLSNATLRLSGELNLLFADTNDKIITAVSKEL